VCGVNDFNVMDGALHTFPSSSFLGGGEGVMGAENKQRKGGNREGGQFRRALERL
jgi:hypothetical protein